MRPVFGFGLVLVLITGCQHIQLENHTLRQAGTLTDLQYRQVLSNIALFVQNPDALPFYAVAGTGGTSIQNSLGTRNVFNWDLFSASGIATKWFFDKTSAELDTTTQAQEQWTTSCVLNPDELSLMRCVYQSIVEAPGCDCEKSLMDFFGKKKMDFYGEAMRQGWYGVGCRKEVPREASYVGHYGKTFVWVTSDGLDYLTRTTLAILDIATIQPTAIAQRMDTDSAAIQALSNKAAALEHILEKYPGDKTDKFYKDVQKNLKAVMIAWAGKLEGHKAEDVNRKVPTFEITAEGFTIPKTITIFEVPSTLQDEVKKQMEMVERPPQEPSFQPRKNLYNPLQQQIIPMIPP